MNTLPNFNGTSTLTMGVELELQLVDLHEFNLTMAAGDFLRRLSEIQLVGEVKPEITQAMIEINTSIHATHNTLITELQALRNIIVEEAAKTYIGICGGGTHPFQKWRKQRIFPTQRFTSVSEQYGYLAKQFTVFGQHIHIACPNGDDALYLCHAMAKYLPHFIALTASSPFHQGIDTSFDCSRLTVISAFPLSGTPPWILSWKEFELYYEKMFRLKIATSIKDFYWDIRPKPEFGTVELRICDTPLTVEKAADFAAYAQSLVSWLLENRPHISHDTYLTYLINRFQAARYGLEGSITDPVQETHIPIAEDILHTCEKIMGHAKKLNSVAAIMRIQNSARSQQNDAAWLRKRYSELESLNDLVRAQTEIWAS